MIDTERLHDKLERRVWAYTLNCVVLGIICAAPNSRTRPGYIQLSELAAKDVRMRVKVLLRGTVKPVILDALEEAVC